MTVWIRCILGAAVATGVGAIGMAAPQQPPTFRGSVDVVMVDALATSGGRPVENLTPADFVLTDNGVPQRILDVTSETVALDLTLVLDFSTTGGAVMTGSLIGTSLAGAVTRIAARLHPNDRVSLVTFAGGVREHLWLAPPSALGRVDPAPAGRMALAPGETALYDALAVALPVAPLPDRRQIAVVFSAGEDTASFLNQSTALEIVRRSSAAIFVVGSTVDPNPLPGAVVEPNAPRHLRDYVAGSRRLPEAFLRRIAEETGGRMETLTPAVYLANSPTHVQFRSTGNSARIDDAFLRAVDAFRAGYVLRYTPAAVAREGWHDLTVRPVKRGAFEVAARRGYWR